MNPRRRALLGLGLLSVIGSGIWAGPALFRSETQSVAAMLRRRLPGLRMEQAELIRFSEAFVIYYERKSRRKSALALAGLRAIEPVQNWSGINWLPGRIRLPLIEFENELFRAFFLGTDFLEVHADPNERVSFLFIPDPYQTGCANLLARFD